MATVENRSVKADDVEALVRVVQMPSISKANLQTICSLNGLSKSGNKADLQKRIIGLLRELLLPQSTRSYLEVRKSILEHARVQSHLSSPQAPQVFFPPLPAGSPSSPSPFAMAYSLPQNGFGGGNRHRSPISPLQQSFQFRSSPFYQIKGRIGEVRTCEAMAQHRNSTTIHVKLQDHPILQPCLTDATTRVMVFCAAGNTGIQEICFPHQSELKVNGGEVKANLRGLKNKPGSTRPVDITSLLRLKPAGYLNNVDFTYALTNKKFYLGVYVCESTPLDKLVEQIARGKRIPKASVVQEIAKKASDPDVVATSQNLSLKCPLSYMRLKDPCRGLKCNHIQCFDATSYLQLQEQGPQWICPICNKSAPFDQLAVDEYVKDILMNTSGSTEQVTIEPDGKWSAQASKEEDKPEPRETSFVDDDDLVIAGETSWASSRGTTTPNRSANFSTSIVGSRESSTMPRSATSNKRPAPEVIDLISDDDDEPPRPAKRQNNTLNGWHGTSY